MAVLHAAAAVALAKIVAKAPTDVDLVTVVVIALLVGAAALWSALDAWRRLPDRGRSWFIGALVAGPVAGLLTVAGKAALVDQTGLGELWPAISGGAAFTALLVLVPAGLGLLVGGTLTPPNGRERDGDADDERAGAAPRPRPAAQTGRDAASAGGRKPRPQPPRTEPAG